MKLALLSDLHANLPALDACIAHARAGGDRVRDQVMVAVPNYDVSDVAMHAPCTVVLVKEPMPFGQLAASIEDEEAKEA